MIPRSRTSQWRTGIAASALCSFLSQAGCSRYLRAELDYIVAPRVVRELDLPLASGTSFTVWAKQVWEVASDCNSFAPFGGCSPFTEEYRDTRIQRVWSTAPAVLDLKMNDDGLGASTLRPGKASIVVEIDTPNGNRQLQRDIEVRDATKISFSGDWHFQRAKEALGLGAEPLQVGGVVGTRRKVKLKMQIVDGTNSLLAGLPKVSDGAQYFALTLENGRAGDWSLTTLSVDRWAPRIARFQLGPAQAEVRFVPISALDQAILVYPIERHGQVMPTISLVPPISVHLSRENPGGEEVLAADVIWLHKSTPVWCADSCPFGSIKASSLTPDVCKLRASSEIRGDIVWRAMKYGRCSARIDLGEVQQTISIDVVSNTTQ